jgi:hypothetical protein
VLLKIYEQNILSCHCSFLRRACTAVRRCNNKYLVHDRFCSGAHPCN